MCVTSMVSDHYFDKYRQPVQWSWPTWDEYTELKRKAAEYDKRTGQTDCEKGDLPLRERAVHDFLVSTSVPRVGAGYVKLQEMQVLQRRRNDFR